MTFDLKKIEEISTLEDEIWQDTYQAIADEAERVRLDYKQDEELARDLTSQIVATTRDEEKAALASDEAVAHGLSNLRRDESSGLNSLLNQPYFARVVTKEGQKEIEFKLGTASFPEKRIIDWRKGPISQLYYDYEEGDEFEETIQGREREGEIILRRSYQGVRDDLQLIETKDGSIKKQNGQWIAVDKDEILSRSSSHDGHLPSILTLITPEQFDLITKDSNQSLLIQGIAGSGKTTVALHRLAWLLHEDNSNAKPENCLVIMFNRTLRDYVETTLPELEITGVPIRTYFQWAFNLLYPLIGKLTLEDPKQSEVTTDFKSSSITSQLIKQFSNTKSHSENLLEIFWEFLSFLTTHQNLVDQPDITNEIKGQLVLKKIGQFDLPILLHLVKNIFDYPDPTHYVLTERDHIVIDEAQDFTFMELQSILFAVKKEQTVCLVGDPAQRIILGRSEFEWKEILKLSGFSSIPPVKLNVSFRTTVEIMELAEYIRNPLEGFTENMAKGRHGNEPKIYRVDAEEVMLEVIKEWIEDKLRFAPNTLCAIICRLPRQAEELAMKLKKDIPSVRWGYRDSFDFSPGIVVTNVHQVKGLEFRHVLIVEPSEENYHSDNVEERNLLYVAVTRAEQTLDFVGFNKETTLLPELAYEEVGLNPEDDGQTPELLLDPTDEDY